MKKLFDWGIRATWALPMSGRVSVENDFFLGVKGTDIAFAGPYKPAHKTQSKKFIDAKGMVLLPGLINAHTHLPMTLFRGLEDDVPLKVWLFERIFPLEKEFVSADFVKTGTELAALECIRFGTTTVSDMYFFVEDSAKAWDKAGLRGIFGQAFMDFPLPEDQELGPDHFGRFHALRKKFAKSDRIQIALSPHAPYTCSDDLLKKIAATSKETGALLHTHLSESVGEEPESLAKFGKTQTERFRDLGVLGPKTICAHAVHLTPSDRKILKDSGTAVIHNPDSNLKLGSGVAPVAEYLAEGVRVALGTDGSASANDLSLFGVMDLATKVQKLTHNDNTAMIASQALWMATQGGANALNLGEQIGSLSPGKKADFILVDFNFPHLQPVHDPISHLVYSAQGLEVDTVFCNGKMLMKAKKHVSLKPAPIFAKAESYRKKIRAFLTKLKAS